MARWKRSSRFTIPVFALAIAFVLALTVNVPAQVQAQLTPNSLSRQLPDQWEFRAPQGPEGSIPDNRQGGASRGDQCIEGIDSLKALVPVAGGTTTAEYPTIYWYMPETSASAAEFTLKDANQQVVYSTKYILAKSNKGVVEDTPSIMSLTLPAFTNLSPLQIDQEYHWSLALICNPLDLSGQPVVEGKIKRVETNPMLALRVNQAMPQERVALYANARIWYETLSSLVELQRERPDSPEVTEAINKLISSVGLNTTSERNTDSQKPVY